MKFWRHFSLPIRTPTPHPLNRQNSLRDFHHFRHNKFYHIVIYTDERRGARWGKLSTFQKKKIPVMSTKSLDAVTRKKKFFLHPRSHLGKIQNETLKNLLHDHFPPSSWRNPGERTKDWGKTSKWMEMNAATFSLIFPPFSPLSHFIYRCV